MLILLHSGFLNSVVGQEGIASPAFAVWADACDALPKNRDFVGLKPAPTVLSSEEMESAIDGYVKWSQGPAVMEASRWLNGLPEKVPGSGFQPFARRMVVDQGTDVLFHGDLHGDIHTLITELRFLQEAYLDGFKLKVPDTRIIFLGDYVDRGNYGVEVIYTLLRLHRANPGRAVLVRGNHETKGRNKGHEFNREWEVKFGLAEGLRLYQKLHGLYETLPVVLYLGKG
ncbi:MAG: metallophosphoesterase family protein, partial [Verrucomicrobiota bacterium]